MKSSSNRKVSVNERGCILQIVGIHTYIENYKPTRKHSGFLEAKFDLIAELLIEVQQKMTSLIIPVRKTLKASSTFQIVMTNTITNS